MSEQYSIRNINPADVDRPVLVPRSHDTIGTMRLTNQFDTEGRQLALEVGGNVGKVAMPEAYGDTVQHYLAREFAGKPLRGETGSDDSDVVEEDTVQRAGDSMASTVLADVIGDDDLESGAEDEGEFSKISESSAESRERMADKALEQLKMLVNKVVLVREYERSQGHGESMFDRRFIDSLVGVYRKFENRTLVPDDINTLIGISDGLKAYIQNGSNEFENIAIDEAVAATSPQMSEILEDKVKLTVRNRRLIDDIRHLVSVIDDFVASYQNGQGVYFGDDLRSIIQRAISVSNDSDNPVAMTARALKLKIEALGMN